MSFKETNNAQFLAGGGEMGALVRSKDWAQTSVGPVEEWPQSLCTTISIVLNSRFPMFLWWGPELICFYNDAYRPSLGQNGKHPGILGMRAEEAWPEIWHIIKPLIDEVLSGGRATWSEDQLIPIYRNGNIEDVYWTFSYSPVNDESGKVAGILVICSETTKKVNSIKILEESNGRYFSNVMQAPVAMSIFRGKDHVVEIANELMLELWGKTKAQVMNRPIFEGLPEAKGQGLEELIDGVFNTGEKYIAHERLVKLPRNGKMEPTYINFVYDALKDPGGYVSGIVAIASEVTSQVISRKKAEDSEKRFRSMAEALPQLVWETDQKGNAVFVSDKWKGYTGIKPTGEADLKAIVHPEDFETNKKKWLHSLATGEIYKSDVRIKINEGDYRWHTVVGEPVFDYENKIKRWVGSFTDIHHEKSFTRELESQVLERTKELKQLNEALKKSEERYHLMVEEVQEYAILYLNREGVVKNWNKGAEKIKGYRSDEIIGKNFSVFYTEGDKKNQLPLKLLDQASRLGKAIQQGWRVRKDGSLFWASVVITAVHNEKNEVIGFSKVTHDLTEKKEADEKLKKYAAQLEQKNKELEIMNADLQSFAYVSSHDLQEPLRKIQTFSTRILEKEYQKLSEFAKDYFRRMQDAAKRMQTLIEDLLAYSRTNSSERNFETTDLNLIFEQVKNELREDIQQKHAIIESSGLCEARIIPFQFRQLIHNIMGNALKFSKPGKAPHIKFRSKMIEGSKLNIAQLSPLKNYCHLTISDNGIGFDPQYQDRIFEVFQRLHGKDEYNGTGIGLAIVKKIVENHNGIILATGELDKGATFDIYLPEP